MATIDLNNQFPVSVATDERGQKHVRVDLSRATKDPLTDQSRLIEHLREAMTLDHNGARIKPAQSKLQAQHHQHLEFPFAMHGVVPTMKLHMRDQPVAEFQVTGHDMVEKTPQHHEFQLAASEVRGLNMALRRDADPKKDVLSKLPYDRKKREGFNPAIHAPITDVHTHLSAQIKSEDLLDVAFAADETGNPEIAYPIELLELLGFKYRKDDPRVVQTKGRGFTPMRDEGLSCEKEGQDCLGIRITQLTDAEKKAIVKQMQIAPDMTMDSGDFDREMYRYRNPFIKHPALAKAVIKKVAEDYARMGVEYAELSTGSMMNPAWFKAMVEALEEIERDGVGPDHKKPTLRFLVGLPRNISPQETLIMLEKIKYLARHPAIVGIDLLGYESNKTSDFNWALANMADWARAPDGRSDLKEEEGWDFKDQFVIRVHAGETTKNVHNVRDAIKIAHQYGVRVRIGHAINAKLDDKAAGWLKEMNADEARDWIATERCPDSNQVYRTKKLVHNQPAMLDCAKFIGTDGGGALNTDPINLAYSALASKWTLQELAENQQFERRYIDRQQGREIKKAASFEQHYGKGAKGLNAFLDGYQKNSDKIPDMRAKKLITDYLPEQFKDAKGKPKRPVLIVGASGSTWQELEAKDQETVRRAARAMIAACDPQKTYFVLGRATKETADGKNSVSNIIDEEIRRHNMDHPMNKFAVLGRYAGASKFPTGDLAETISWIQDIEQGRDDVPRSMVEFVKKNKGLVVALAGSEFTAQIAHGASYKGVPYALHVPVTDLRNDKDDHDLPRNPLEEVSQTATTHSRFGDFKQFIDNVFGQVGEHHVFRNREELNAFVRDGVKVEDLHKINLTHVEKSDQRHSGERRGRTTGGT